MYTFFCFNIYYYYYYYYYFVVFLLKSFERMGSFKLCFCYIWNPKVGLNVHENLHASRYLVLWALRAVDASCLSLLFFLYSQADTPLPMLGRSSTCHQKQFVNTKSHGMIDLYFLQVKNPLKWVSLVKYLIMFISQTSEFYLIHQAIPIAMLFSSSYPFFPSSNFTTNSLIFISELPPTLTALLASSLHLLAFLLISSPFSPSMTPLMHFSSSSLVTIPTSSFLALTPTFHTSSTNLAFIGWSLLSVTHTIGTPRPNPSNVEFHPQWVTKQPIAWWASTSSWLHHDTTIPVSPTEFRNPVGNFFSDSFMTHRKGLLLAFKPHAISSTCSAEMFPMLPKDTYITDLGGFVSSHVKHWLLVGFQRLAP